MGSTPSSPSQATALVEAVHIIRGGEAVWKTFLAAVDPLSTEERTMAKEPATQSTDDGSRDGLVSELGCAQAGTLGDISPARVGLDGSSALLAWLSWRSRVVIWRN